MRHAMVEMVLATDISRHFEYLVKFNKVSNISGAVTAKFDFLGQPSCSHLLFFIYKLYH